MVASVAKHMHEGSHAALVGGFASVLDMPRTVGPSVESAIAGLARSFEVVLERQDLTIQKYRVLAYLAWKPGFPKAIHRPRRKYEFSVLLGLTGPNRPPIHRAHAARRAQSCGRCCVSGMMEIRSRNGSLTL